MGKLIPTDKVVSSTSLNDLALELNNIIREKRKQNTEPLSWEFAEKCYKTQCFYIYRSLADEERYEKSRHVTSLIWDGITSQIKQEVFKMKTSYDNTLQRWTVKDPIKGM